MSEENKKQNPELSESALEGVSGGYDMEQLALTIARDTCWECKQIGMQDCGGAGPEALARIILSSEQYIGAGRFDFRCCPYVIGPVG